MAAPEPALGLLLAQDTDREIPDRTGAVVHVDSEGRLIAVTRAAAVAARHLTEDEHLLRAGQVFDDPVDLGTVDPLHLIAIIEVRDRRGALEQHEAVLLQRQLAGDRPDAVDADGIIVERHVGPAAIRRIEDLTLASPHVFDRGFDEICGRFHS